MANWYCGSTKWTAVTAWAASTAYSVGDLRRQLAAPTAGNERVFRCTTAGTSAASEPSWTLTKSGTTNDGSCVWTEVTGNDTYGWSAAHARLSNALAWMAAGDRCWVSQAHAETAAAAITLTSPGTSAAPCQILCVSDSATPPTTLAATATVTTSSGSLTTVGFAYAYGVSLIASGTSAASVLIASSSSPTYWNLENCDLKITGASTGSRIVLGGNLNTADDQGCALTNVRLQFSSTSQALEVRGGHCVWQNTTGAILGATIPAVLFVSPANTTGGDLLVYGVDLSALGSGKSLVDVSRATSAAYDLRNCKLGSAVAITTGSVAGQGGVQVRAENCDSSGTNYRYHRQAYAGTITQETTLVRTGGASNGATSLALKMATSAGASFASPLVSDPIVFWHDSTATEITPTIAVLTDGVTLKNDECWLEIEYLGATAPQAAIASTRATNILTAGEALTTDGTSTWTTTGLSSPVKQKMSAAITPNSKGPVLIRVVLAKPSTTIYVDPLAQL